MAIPLFRGVLKDRRCTSTTPCARIAVRLAPGRHSALTSAWSFAVVGADEIDDARVADEQLRDVDAERLVGEVADLGISSQTTSSSPEDVSMMPSPPAWIRRASWLRAIHPIGACTIGIADAEELVDACVNQIRTTTPAVPPSAVSDSPHVHYRGGACPPSGVDV